MRERELSRIDSRASIFLAVVCVAFFFASNGEASSSLDVSERLSRLDAALRERIARDDLPKMRLELGGGLVYTVLDSDDEALFVSVSSLGGTKIPWLWRDLGPHQRVQLYRYLPSTPDVLSDVAVFCLERGLEEEAHDVLRRLQKKGGREKRLVDELIASHRGGYPPPGGYVIFEGRFVTPAERDAGFVSSAEAWLIEKQAEEDLENARAEDLFEKAVLLSRKGFFRAGVNLMRKTAVLAKGTDLGIRAKNRSRENGVLLIQPLQQSGDPENRVDVYLLGDGYVLKDRAQKRHTELNRQLLRFFFQREACQAYRPYFNFYSVNTWSKEQGVDTPTHDASTAYGGKWSGMAQGQVAVDTGLVYGALDQYAPGWDTALVMVRRGGGGTGGNRVAAFAHASPGIAFHEFGHSFVGLLDEYSTQVSKRLPVGPGPVGINLTNSERIEDCPWKHWLDAKTPGVGLYRGGAGRSDGVWHPSQSCVMGTGGNEFCVVCREAFVLRVYEYARPIDEHKPRFGTVPVDSDRTKPITLSVTLLKPESHFLETKWTLQNRALRVDREMLADGRVRESVSLAPSDLKLVQGYENAVFLEVRDPTDWVLSDPRGLLRQKVSWRFRVLTEAEKKRTRRTK